MDSGISQTLKGSLEHFLTSLEGGNDTLTSFLTQWTSLSDTIQSHHNHLKEETIATAHAVASTIGSIAYRMLKLEMDKDLLFQQLAEELSHVLNDDMENLVIRDELPISKGYNSSPVYIKPCCQWLLVNLHNPYPPKSVRNSICRQTGSPVKDIDAWFTDARKRMGWNELRRTHFSNKREKIIDAATSFFKPSRDFLKLDPSSQSFPLGKPDDYSMAFVEMEERAQRMFCDKYEETPLARTLNHEDQDSRPLSHIKQQPNQLGLHNQQINPTLKRKRASHAYPSPERSPERTPEPLSPSAIDVPSPVISATVSLKRRRSSSETSANDSDSGQPQKRLRSADSEDFDSALAAASLPSPAASLDDVSSPVGNELLLLSSITPPALPALTPTHVSTSIQPIHSTKRKRCFSDSEDQRPSKYLRPAPISRMASDPLPIPTELLHQSSAEDLLQDYLVNQTFFHDIPPVTFNEVFDDSIPVDVNYYQYPLSSDVFDNDLNFSIPTPAPVQESVELSLSFELDTWAKGLQGYNLQDFLNTENSTYTIGLDPLLLEPNYLQFYEAPAINELSISTPSTLDWMTSINQPIDLSTSKVDTGMALKQPSPVAILEQRSTAMELAAKRGLAEMLRAELQRLEADIA